MDFPSFFPCFSVLVHNQGSICTELKTINILEYTCVRKARKQAKGFTHSPCKGRLQPRDWEGSGRDTTGPKWDKVGLGKQCPHSSKAESLSYNSSRQDGQDVTTALGRRPTQCGMNNLRKRWKWLCQSPSPAKALGCSRRTEVLFLSMRLAKGQILNSPRAFWDQPPLPDRCFASPFSFEYNYALVSLAIFKIKTDWLKKNISKVVFALSTEIIQQHVVPVLTFHLEEITAKDQVGLLKNFSSLYHEVTGF